MKSGKFPPRKSTHSQDGTINKMTIHPIVTKDHVICMDLKLQDANKSKKMKRYKKSNGDNSDFIKIDI